MSTWGDDLPLLDTHAHIAPDVTAAQLGGLGDSQIFSVTRSLAEAEAAILRRDANIIWGLGLHPGAEGALAAFSTARLTALLDRFVLIGEVGLHRQAGDLPGQRTVFRQVLEAACDRPILLSIHSAGATSEVIADLAAAPHPGAILHWFLGSPSEVSTANALGCFFSVNAAMGTDLLAAMPSDRMLPETDYPATRGRGGGRLPGDTATIEERLAEMWQLDVGQVRRRFFQNLRTLVRATDTLDRLPDRLADLLLTA